MSAIALRIADADADCETPGGLLYGTTQITNDADPQPRDHAAAGPHQGAPTNNANVNKKGDTRTDETGDGGAVNKTPAPWRGRPLADNRPGRPFTRALATHMPGSYMAQHR